MAERYYVYRYGSNAANQSLDDGPVHIATVNAESVEAAETLAAQRVNVYNNQYLDGRLASEVDAEESDVDDQFEWSEGDQS